MSNEAQLMLDKIYNDKQQKNKELVKDILDVLEAKYKDQLEGLTEEEMIAFIAQIIGLEKNLSKIVEKGINYETLMKVKKIIDKRDN